MIVFRLSKSIFAADLSGTGAEKTGGRWNSKGVPILYTCQSRALAATEIAVHTPLGILPDDYQIISIEIPDTDILEFSVSELPSDWRSFPHPHSTQKLGDGFFLDAGHLSLKVPSAVVQGEYNFLINPHHRKFRKVKIIKIESFNFDSRLFKK
jgi:RES domain-containing protein